jgi:hypothetical protein
MEKLRRVYFRFIPIQTPKTVVSNDRCIAVGFLNIGTTPAFVNRELRIPDFNPALPITPFFLPINEGERDATRYDITFGQTAPFNRKVLVIFKEVDLIDYEKRTKK